MTQLTPNTVLPSVWDGSGIDIILFNNNAAIYGDVYELGIELTSSEILTDFPLTTPVVQFLNQLQTEFEPDDEIVATVANTTAALASELKLDDLIAPAFSIAPPDSLIVVAGEYFSYSLGNFEIEEDGVEITVDLGTAETFIRFDEFARTLVIYEGTSEVGTFAINITLSYESDYGTANTDYTI